jgi:hypothetical protein
MLVLTAFGAVLEPMAHARLTVNKADPRQQLGHEGLALADPDAARFGHLGPFLLDRAQVFFCVSGQDRATRTRPSRDAP